MGKTIITLIIGLVIGGAGALVFGGGALMGVGAGAGSGVGVGVCAGGSVTGALSVTAVSAMT